MVCINCEKEFEESNKKQRFCSCSCANSWNNKNIKYKKVELKETDTKICIKCNEKKLVKEFYKRENSVDGYRNDCKKCLNERVCSHPNRKQNKKNYYENNKEKVKIKVRKYFEDNRDEVLKKKREYQKTHKEQRNNTHKNRYNTDILYKLNCNVHGYISKAFKRNGYKKSSKTFELIGCTFEFLKNYIEYQFKEGMSWENYGKWHIDHKIPTSWAKTEEELKELCKYTNLQPLWAEDNLSKKNYYAHV